MPCITVCLQMASKMRNDTLPHRIYNILLDTVKNTPQLYANSRSVGGGGHRNNDMMPLKIIN